jgi:hypothetical protein
VARQVQDGSSLRAGQANGDVDDLAAHGGAARDGVLFTGQYRGGARQVVDDRRARYPGGVGAEAPEGIDADSPDADHNAVGQFRLSRRVCAAGFAPNEI